MSGINRPFFFHQVEGALFSGNVRSAQRAGLTVLLDYWETSLARDDDRWLAYALATVHHETDRTMQPIREYGSDEYKRLRYDVTGSNPTRAIKNGNTQEGDGLKYVGRGYVQLTWKNNYALAGNMVGRDLVEHPDDALLPEIAAPILFQGMIAGWFTGKKLADYFSTETEDWRNARRIINGLDKADLIKGYALQYYAAISYTTG